MIDMAGVTQTDPKTRPLSVCMPVPLTSRLVAKWASMEAILACLWIRHLGIPSVCSTFGSLISFFFLKSSRSDFAFCRVCWIFTELDCLQTASLFSYRSSVFDLLAFSSSRLGCRCNGSMNNARVPLRRRSTMQLACRGCLHGSGGCFRLCGKPWFLKHIVWKGYTRFLSSLVATGQEYHCWSCCLFY